MTSSPQPTAQPTIIDIEDAARRLSGMAVVTPLLESPVVNKRLGGRLLIKAEPMQRTGSFKFRGAYNRLSRIDGDAKKRGVVAYSSGNHAQGVAAAAQILGMPAVIVMPADAPAIKIRNTRSYGAEVVTYDRLNESREAIGQKLQRERGAVLVPPFDDPFIIAGQGTIGLELAQQAEAAGAALDAVLAACSGGGLLAGIATAMKARQPSVAVYAVEPQGFDDLSRSLKSGKRETNDPGARSICDALLAPTPGELTFSINSHLLSGGFAVSDDEVRQAMAVAFEDYKLVVEPGGAVALAAVLSGKFPARGKTVAVVCSGGNVDPDVFASAIRARA
ncbi:MAG TPA: threonine/serine dehydratase [Alphaproteobacteria bacterium]|nr:threonine/serine dehydratase [Alphaproteobacteria bacterium]